MTSMLLHEQIADLCERLKFQVVADQYEEWAQQAVNNEDSYVDFLARILEHEARQARSRQVLVKMAGFPTIKTLDDYDYTFHVGRPGLQGKHHFAGTQRYGKNPSQGPTAS